MRKVNVLHLTFDMAIAGTEQVIRQLVENTDPLEFKTSIFCIDGKIGVLGQELIKKGVHIEASPRGASGLDFSLIKSLRKYIKSNDIDILHCHQYTPYVYGLFASVGTPTPVIFTEHGRFYPDTYKWKRLLLNPILSLFTAHITAISKATAKALIKYENFPKRKIDVVYNGIKCENEISNFTANLKSELSIENKNAFILGTISRLDVIKNQKMMVNAFSQVLQKFPEAILLIVGDGPERKALNALTISLGIESQVIFTGFKVNPQQYFKIIDVFLLSSLSEGTSMTLLEAMAFKKPTVVTDVGGNPEIVVNEMTGLITQSCDQNAFSEAIIRLLNDDRLRTTLGTNGFNRYSTDFTVEKMIKKYQKLYRVTIAK